MVQSAANTHEEILRKILSSVSDLKLTPDADLEWDVQLETLILQKLREPIDRIQALSNAPAPPGAGGMPPGMGGPMGMGGPQPGPGGMMPGMGLPSVNPSAAGPSSPNPDELRRLLG